MATTRAARRQGTDDGDSTAAEDGDDARRGAILVKEGAGLRDADWGDESDSYVLFRLGNVGSAWDDKPASTERRSRTMYDDLSSCWQYFKRR